MPDLGDNIAQTLCHPESKFPFKSFLMNYRGALQRPILYDCLIFTTAQKIYNGLNVQRPPIYSGPDLKRPWFTTALIYNNLLKLYNGPYCKYEKDLFFDKKEIYSKIE